MIQDLYPAEAGIGAWHLEEFDEHGRVTRCHAISLDPFRIGRSAAANITLNDRKVSSKHAEVIFRDGRPWLRDLMSSNGTFRNGKRVSDVVPLDPGDVIHFASIEMLVHFSGADSVEDGTMVVSGVGPNGDSSRAGEAAALREMIEGGRVLVWAQPIVDLATRARTGFELLGRGVHPRLPGAPWPLFEIAERIGLGVDLSRLFRARGVTTAFKLPNDAEIFINTHPGELGSPDFVPDLNVLRRAWPDRRITIEVHETAVVSTPLMAQVRAALRDFDIRLAYDDFGAGQARLTELAAVPPDYLKFDMSMIRDIDRAPESRRVMLRSLVQMVVDQGIVPLAEGIETEGELEACLDAGFVLAQGFFMGRPAPVDSYLASPEGARSAAHV